MIKTNDAYRDLVTKNDVAYGLVRLATDEEVDKENETRPDANLEHGKAVVIQQCETFGIHNLGRHTTKPTYVRGSHELYKIRELSDKSRSLNES